MSQNLQINPTTKDYVLDSTGSPISSDRVEEAAYIALAIPQNEWLYGDPNQGSKLNTLNNVKRTANIEQQISSFVMDAMDRQLISTGLASAAEVENIQATTTGSSNQLEIIPNTVQISNQLIFVGV